MIDSLITVGLGFLITLMGYGKVPVSKNPSKNQEYLDKYGTFLRVGGIFLIVIGLVLVVARGMYFINRKS